MSASRQQVKVVEHPLVAAKLARLRARTTLPEEFRRNLQELSILLVVEAARAWETTPIEVETPLARCAGQSLRRSVVIVPILRAGLGMLDGVTRLLPEYAVGHIGVYRDPKTLRPMTYYCRLPAELSESEVVMVDPMLATGHTACEALTILKKNGAKRITFVCLLASPPGLEQVQSSHPDISILTAAIDPELNSAGYIVPGLGDAGDRYFGTE